ncbi:MAG: ADP-glyceromanno-heptose 6-epimerase [Alphaproteobacteria bacterium]|nr:ADP-glyceromanno-heptose 6-epimerase [Alphaproteobacteria bacterium]MCD8519736.1 ADP-glyceromanno-heptose 6-epimerase [Alphaproteobacteria bacterium]MCD8571296.1 ADP-glyceromanno-heptose 6-epimerase [Alphaproteobacteria bacterium]
MIVVTGGAGFIGSNLVAGLEEAGCRDIVIVDTMGDDDKWRNIVKHEIRDIVHPNNIFVFLDEYADDIEMIFHLGAISDTTETDTDLVMHNNFSLAREIWRWCAEHKVRMLYASSYATYGDGKSEIGFSDDDSPEMLAKLRPLNPYGWSKHLFDRRVSRIVHGRDVVNENIPPQWVGLKFFNAYGPNEYHKGEHMSVVSKIYPQILAGAAARLFKSSSPQYADGQQMRDFIWVGDCVDVMVWFYKNPKINGLYNLGTGEGRTFEEMAEAMAKAAGKPSKIMYVDMPEALKDRYQYFTQAEMGKLRKAGYDKPFTSLEDGLKLYVEKYLSQSDQYR